MSENLDEQNCKAEKVLQERKRVKTGFYYSFLTIVLLLCLLQIGFGVILNISKTISYRTKISTMTKIRDSAEVHNRNLKQDIKSFSSMSSLEGIARNNLKMAGEDEVLVIINNTSQQNEKNKKRNKKKHKKSRGINAAAN